MGTKRERETAEMEQEQRRKSWKMTPGSVTPRRIMPKRTRRTAKSSRTKPTLLIDFLASAGMSHHEKMSINADLVQRSYHSRHIPT